MPLCGHRAKSGRKNTMITGCCHFQIVRAGCCRGSICGAMAERESAA